MKLFTRRSVVKGALFCSASAAFATTPPRAMFPVDPRARIAVATYPFRESIIAPGNQDRNPKKPGMDLASLTSLCGRNLGVTGLNRWTGTLLRLKTARSASWGAAFDVPACTR